LVLLAAREACRILRGLRWRAVCPGSQTTEEGRVDTIIFLLILGTLLATRSRRGWPVPALFLASLAATLLLFRHHVTSPLPLNF
jgi:hypothetical protein